jgi:hypothetical protein
MLADQPLNLIQFVRFETVIGCQAHWVKPEFGLVALGFDMDMRRFIVFVAEKEKAVTPDA